MTWLTPRQVVHTCPSPNSIQVYERLGDMSFAVADPRVWSMLPVSLHLEDNYTRFK